MRILQVKIMLVQYIIDNFENFTITQINDSTLYKLDHKYSEYVKHDSILIYLSGIRLNINSNIVFYTIKNLNVGICFTSHRKINNEEFLEFLRLKLC